MKTPYCIILGVIIGCLLTVASSYQQVDYIFDRVEKSERESDSLKARVRQFEVDSIISNRLQLSKRVVQQELKVPIDSIGTGVRLLKNLKPYFRPKNKCCQCNR